MQILYLALRGIKVPRFMGGSIGPRMDICVTSALPIPMVPRLHQSNGYIKRKLRAWRVQKCFALVGTDTVLITAWPQSTPFHGGWYGAPNGNMRNFGSTNPMVRRLHQRNGYFKRKLRAWRVQKCIAQASADTVLTTAWKHSTQFHMG